MAVVFDHRTRSYQACVLMLMLCTMLTTVGYSTTHWVDSGQNHYGLWMQCLFRHQYVGPSQHQQQTVCFSHDGSTPIDEMLRVPRILITLEMAALVIACVVAIVINCRRYVPASRQRYLEFITCLAGLLGSVGTIGFCVHKTQLSVASSTFFMLSWSFYLVLFSSLIVLVIACVITLGDDVIPGSDDVILDVPVSPEPGKGQQVMIPDHKLGVVAVTLGEVKVSL